MVSNCVLMMRLIMRGLLAVVVLGPCQMQMIKNQPCPELDGHGSVAIVSDCMTQMMCDV